GGPTLSRISGVGMVLDSNGIVSPGRMMSHKLSAAFSRYELEKERSLSRGNSALSMTAAMAEAEVSLSSLSLSPPMTPAPEHDEETLSATDLAAAPASGMPTNNN
ncbi:unnamed protein product, partial [Discosporangium mesarthrocarpum]